MEVSNSSHHLTQAFHRFSSGKGSILMELSPLLPPTSPRSPRVADLAMPATATDLALLQRPFSAKCDRYKQVLKRLSDTQYMYIDPYRELIGAAEKRIDRQEFPKELSIAAARPFRPLGHVIHRPTIFSGYGGDDELYVEKRKERFDFSKKDHFQQTLQNFDALLSLADTPSEQGFVKGCLGDMLIDTIWFHYQLNDTQCLNDLQQAIDSLEVAYTEVPLDKTLREFAPHFADRLALAHTTQTVLLIDRYLDKGQFCQQNNLKPKELHKLARLHLERAMQITQQVAVESPHLVGSFSPEKTAEWNLRKLDLMLKLQSVTMKQSPRLFSMHEAQEFQKQYEKTEQWIALCSQQAVKGLLALGLSHIHKEIALRLPKVYYPQACFFPVRRFTLEKAKVKAKEAVKIVPKEAHFIERMPHKPGKSLACQYSANDLAHAIYEQPYSRALNMRMCYLDNQTLCSDTPIYLSHAVEFFPKVELEVKKPAGAFEFFRIRGK